MEYKNTPQGVRYFWKLLDLQKNNALTLFTLNYFFRVRVVSDCVLLLFSYLFVFESAFKRLLLQRCKNLALILSTSLMSLR
jgi:hypothetical protein